MIIDKIKSTISKNKLLQDKEHLLIAVSGGPDSVFLLHVLSKLKQSLGLKISIAHLNHCLRGTDSDKDEKFVLKLGEKLDIPVFISKVDIKKFAKQEKLSIESAARTARYNFFLNLAKVHNFKKLALAHTKDDQVETVLMRILRGTGIKGLGAMQPLSEYGNISLVRPLLEIEKTEILKYLKKNKIRSRVDKSNFQQDYFRNQIRLDLIPHMIKYSPALKDNICRLAFNARSVDEYLKSRVNVVFKKTVTKSKPNQLAIDSELYLKQPAAVKTELIRKVIFDICGHLKNIDFKHIVMIDDFISAAEGQGKNLDLPNNIKITKTRKKFRFSLGKPAGLSNKIKRTWKIKCGQKIKINELGCAISLSLVKRNKGKTNFKCSEKSGALEQVEYLDLDKVKMPLTVRTRRPGDMFYPLGSGGAKKLKSFFIDRKTDDYKKDRIPLIVSDNNIAVVGFMRIGEKFKVTNKTKNLLKISLKTTEKT